MAYIIVILTALFTKAYFNTKLCRGEYGFFKTYFIYGGIGSFAILFAVFGIFGPHSLRNDGGTGVYTILNAMRLASLCLAVYLSGIALALYKLRSRSNFSPLMNIYLVTLLVAFLVTIPTVLVTAPVMCAVYAGTLLICYNFVWGKSFIESPVSSN
ncbi:hypothetical protein ACI2KC_21175 [Pseudomonas monteilii]